MKQQALWEEPCDDAKPAAKKSRSTTSTCGAVGGTCTPASVATMPSVAATSSDDGLTRSSVSSGGPMHERMRGRIGDARPPRDRAWRVWLAWLIVLALIGWCILEARGSKTLFAEIGFVHGNSISVHETINYITHGE
jgi:hypothetical protein